MRDLFVPLEHLGIVFLLPLLVGLLDFALDFLQSVVKHFGKIRLQLIDVFPVASDFLVLLICDLLHLFLDVRLLLRQVCDDFVILVSQVLQHARLSDQLILRRFELTSHVGDNVVGLLTLLIHCLLQDFVLGALVPLRGNLVV